jgi:NAD(P)-dependent dehydrogenase (short-subunit alcohol dehydrogenase family)
MGRLPHRLTDLRAAIFGATGGIGAALVAQLENSGRYGLIYVGGRNLPSVKRPETIPFSFDLTDETSIAQAARMIGESGPIDLAIVATGMLHRADQAMPEKSWRAIDGQAMAEMFAINTIGPALIAKYFLPLMWRDGRCEFAVLSARVGSIADNRLGGWHSYRASKAALNMLVRNFAIELASRNPHGIAVAIHPGTVDTILSKPFQRGVPQAKLFLPDQSAANILSVIDQLSAADSGGLFAWNGERIPY